MDERRRSLRVPAGAALLIAVAAAAAFRLWRLRYLRTWIDESDNMTLGWLISDGHRLYDSVFSHHTPLAYMAAHAVAVLSPSDDVAHFRLAAAAFYLFPALALVGAPLAEDRRGSGCLAAAVFVAGAATFAPLWAGHMLLTDLLWGCAFAAFAVLVLLPLCLAREISTPAAALGGVLGVVWVYGSLITVYPLVLSASLVAGLAAISPPHRRVGRAALAPAAVGAAVAGAGMLVWLITYGDLPGFFEQALRFNFEFYAAFQPARSGGVLALGWTGLAAALHDWLIGGPAWDRAPSTFFALGTFLLCGAWGWRIGRSAAGGPLPRWGVGVLSALVLLALSASLRLRGEASHDAPYFVWVLAAGAALIPALEPGRAFASVVAAAVLAGFLSWPAASQLRFRFDERDESASIGRMAATFEYVRMHSRPQDELLSLNVRPIAYLAARRHPAHAAVFYLPWQAAWERAHPERPGSCEQVRADPPRFVYLRPVVVERHPWLDYGACLDEFVRRHYRPVEASGVKDLWELHPGA